MGSFVRDFRGNELQWLEDTEASDTLVGEIDDYIGEWTDKAQDLQDLASNAENLVRELEELRDKKQAELDGDDPPNPVRAVYDNEEDWWEGE